MNNDALVSALAAQTLRLYTAIIILMVVGIVALVGYSLSLGPLVGAGVESSFGYALAIMFVMGAVAFHVVDRAYRLWPLGRRVHPAEPAPITDAGIAVAVKVAVFVVAAAAVAYILGTLIVG